MSMTREEARIELQAMKDTFEEYEPGGSRCQMALKVALTALRPVSRKQVEQIKGVWIFNEDWWEFRCSECHKSIGNIEKYKFCPHCGAPMTDEAVQMVMERLEALKDGKTD